MAISQLPDADEKSIESNMPVMVIGALPSNAPAIVNSSINALRMKPSNDWPSGVFIGPTPLHIILVWLSPAALNSPTLIFESAILFKEEILSTDTA